MWRTVVYGPVELVALGLSVGFGFMTTENIEYFTAINLQPDEGKHVEVTSLVSRVVFTLLRCLFNLHPLLTGLVAVRLSSRIYSKGLDRTGVTDWTYVSIDLRLEHVRCRPSYLL
jgi:hypothetical protein